MKLSNLILSNAITLAFTDSVCKDVNGPCKQNKADTLGLTKDGTNENGIVPLTKAKGTPLNSIYF